MDVGRPNAEIGQKMASGQLLFLALHKKPNKIHKNLISMKIKNHIIQYKFWYI